MVLSTGMSKGVNPTAHAPTATHYCHLNRVPHVSSFPLKRLPARQADREHGPGRLCQHRLKAARTDKVSTRQNGASPGSNGASLGEGTANSGRSSNGSSSSSVVQGTDLLEKPYSNNGNGASYQGNGSSYSKQGSAGQRREAAVADALEDAAIIDIDARSSSNADDDDACASGHLGECAVSRSMDIEFQATAQTPECANQQQAAVQEAAESPKTKKSGSNWSRVGKLSTIQRTLQIWGFAIALVFRLWWVKQKFTYGKKGMTPDRIADRKAKLAIWVREGLVKLGPTFIKIGQQFSTRVDVLSPEFVKELEKLQDNVPAFSSTEAVAIIERNLGGKLLDKFDSFTMEPIAAASLGQVHLATLNGQKVVVKVQRPGLKQLFDIDLKNVRVLAQWLQSVDPKSDGAARDWVAIYDECSRILYQEIDYTMEGESADRFRKNFGAADWLKVPSIFWERTTSEVLTMEYCPGVKINRISELDKMGVDRKRLARLAVESYLQQILTHGFFHADPHPGNIAVDGENGGRLIYYDFGMMGGIPSDVRSGLLELFYGVYEKDPDRCIDALVTMGVLVPGGDRTAVRRTAEFFLKNFEERLKAQKQEAASNPEYGSTYKPQSSKEDRQAKRKQILSNIGEDLLVASADKPFRFPATFTFVVRSFTVLDGIGKGLDPRFDISEIAAPYARGLLLEGNPQYAALAKDFRRRVGLQNRAVKNLFRGPNMIEDVRGTLTKLERGDLKLRVRALEAERALARVQIMQTVMTTTVVACTLVNIGTILTINAMARAATVSFVGAGLSTVVTLMNFLKVKNLEKKEAQLVGSG
ncbi:hypothetical protein ABBQ32_011679 [Trebouxia sp. C0010 RCD-2024]